MSGQKTCKRNATTTTSPLLSAKFGAIAIGQQTWTSLAIGQYKWYMDIWPLGHLYMEVEKCAIGPYKKKEEEMAIGPVPLGTKVKHV